jgi:hypothetical protein
MPTDVSLEVQASRNKPQFGDELISFIKEAVGALLDALQLKGAMLDFEVREAGGARNE